jgi:hypothetical protein
MPGRPWAQSPPKRKRPLPKFKPKATKKKVTR